jgi:hypothetical protein
MKTCSFAEKNSNFPSLVITDNFPKGKLLKKFLPNHFWLPVGIDRDVLYYIFHGIRFLEFFLEIGEFYLLQ